MKDQILRLVNQGKTIKDIRSELDVTHYQVREAKKERGNPHLPPIEQAILLLESGHTHQEVQERWGEEILSEALSFYEIPSVEEYKEKYKL